MIMQIIPLNIPDNLQKP